MTDKLERANQILEAGTRLAKTPQGAARLEEAQVYPGYAEPGYHGGPVALGDWNRITRWNRISNTHDTLDNTPARVGEQLEKAGVELEWDDEWTECEGCHLIVRTQADSYSWTRSYVELDEYVYCESCLLADSDLVEEHLRRLEGEDGKADTIGIDLEGAGYVKIASEETGLYGGQCGSPARTSEELTERGAFRHLYQIDGVGQFDADWSVWVHQSQAHLVQDQDITTTGSDPAEAMKRGLKSATVQMHELKGEGVRMASINPDGTATVKLVSPQDFVDGKALDD